MKTNIIIGYKTLFNREIKIRFKDCYKYIYRELIKNKNSNTLCLFKNSKANFIILNHPVVSMLIEDVFLHRTTSRNTFCFEKNEGVWDFDNNLDYFHGVYSSMHGLCKYDWSFDIHD